MAPVIRSSAAFRRASCDGSLNSARVLVRAVTRPMVSRASGVQAPRPLDLRRETLQPGNVLKRFVGIGNDDETSRGHGGERRQEDGGQRGGVSVQSVATKACPELLFAPEAGPAASYSAAVLMVVSSIS